MVKGKELLVIVLLLIILATPFVFVKLKPKKEEKMEREILSVRRSAVAGMFYPAEKGALEERIKTFLNETRPLVKKEGFLRILIVPHAGYDYSGQVAATGFAQLEEKDYSTVILLGGSHQAFFEGAAIDENDTWETPLGKVEIDKELAKKIIEGCKGISFSSSAHAQEHSLEVELPFLQSVLSGFKIVPILLGETDESLLEALSEFLNKNITPETLIVISTDLSHYPAYEVANQVDRVTVDSILSGDAENFEATTSTQMEKGHPNLATCVCGEKAVKVGMILAQKLGEGRWELIKYANSGDVEIGDKSRVVGYASIGFYAKNSKLKTQNSIFDPPAGGEKTSDESRVKLQLKSQKELLKIARETLESYLTSKKIPEFKVEDEQLEQKLGAFVTLRKNGNLRGCIGQIEPSDDPLWQVVRKMAIEAATKDFRFLPVDVSELKDIKIEISVLSKPEKITDPYKIELGRHGVIIQKGPRKGVFLPQVATENNWDLETFMAELCSQKAGLPWDCWKKGGVDIYTFEAQVFEEE